MNSLILNKNQFAVGKAEFKTGHVLNNDGTIYKNGNDEMNMYEIFNNYEEAKKFVIQKVINNPEIECWIINAEKEVLFTWDFNCERKFK